MDNNFRIYALGDNFDVDAFVASSSLTPSFVWRVGEPKGKNKRGSPYPTSGIVFELGAGADVPFLEQDEIAIEFIKQHRDGLKALSEFPNVTHFTLGLQYTRLVQGNVIGFTMGVSPWLMWHLLDIGCRLTHYVHLERDDSDQSA
jgi:hypothetical protein